MGWMRGELVEAFVDCSVALLAGLEWSYKVEKLNHSCPTCIICPRGISTLKITSTDVAGICTCSKFVVRGVVSLSRGGF